MAGSHGWAEIDTERKREIIAAIAGGTSTRGPVHAELDVTDRCNVACYFCNQQDVRTKEQLSIEHVRRLVDELVEGGLKSVRLSGGGDPLYHREIGEIFDHLNARGVVVDNLTTNGALLNPEVARRLIDYEAREAVISLNAVDEADYHRMMQVPPGIFHKVLANVRHLVESRSESRRPEVVVQFLLDRSNYERLPEMYELGRTLGADRISIGLVLLFRLRRWITPASSPTTLRPRRRSARFSGRSSSATSATGGCRSSARISNGARCTTRSRASSATRRSRRSSRRRRPSARPTATASSGGTRRRSEATATSTPAAS
jgi:sulfatase maturation enzyme AslB (radical SAM superfamily)